MRSVEDCENFRESAHIEIISACKKCGGYDFDCSCREHHELTSRLYEACVPRDFWHIKATEVNHNTEAFKQIVIPYCRKIKVARANGYGLLFLGDNGVGKTMFVNYVLLCALRKGLSIYYTTLPRLDANIKQSFNEPIVGERLRWMLTSDFVAIDEMGKEKFKKGDSYIRTQIELILKERYDERMPTLIATNTDLNGLNGMYGSTLTSMLFGKYKMITMDPGDYRKKIGKTMDQRMGYKNEI